MLPKGSKPYQFPIDKDMYLVVDKTALIQAMHEQFQVILAPEDIEILNDGIKMQISLGVSNPLVSALKLREITDFFTTEGIREVKFDDQVDKIWLLCESDFLFLDSGDDKLKMTPAGVDAPEGTIQVELGEGKVYTLVRCKPGKINEAVKACIALIGKDLTTSRKFAGNKVVDHRIVMLRQKFGILAQYNDYVRSSAPKIKRIIAHV